MDRSWDEKIENITMAVGLQWMNFSQFRNIFHPRVFSVLNNFDFT